MTEGNTERCIKVSAVRTVGDHVMYPQMSSEPEKPGCVLRRVTGGGRDLGGNRRLCSMRGRVADRA
jgi:hypothetical protein